MTRHRTRKRCKKSQILNPKTNRCVKRSGAIGKRLLERSRSRRRARMSRSLKPCKKSQIRNPETNRCVSKTGAIGRKLLQKSHSRRRSQRASYRKPCKKSQIRNPKTGRCVSKTGTIGRKILRARASGKGQVSRFPTQNIQRNRHTYRGGANRIPNNKRARLLHILSNNIDVPGSILDFNSGRFVPENSRAGQAIRKKGITKSFQKFIIDNLNTMDIHLYIYQHGPGINNIGVKLGSGAFGSIYTIVNNGDPTPYVVKVQMIENEATDAREVNIQRYAARQGLAPAVLAHHIQEFPRSWNVRPLSYITMFKIDGTIEDYVKEPLSPRRLLMLCEYFFRIIIKLYETEITHGDLHLGNLGYMENVNMFRQPQYIDIGFTPAKGRERIESNFVAVMIDFGWATRGRPNPRLELLQLIRTSSPDYMEIDESNAKYIQKNLIDFYNHSFHSNDEMFGPEFHDSKLLTLNNVDDRWDEAMEEQAHHARNHEILYYNRQPTPARPRARRRR